MTAIMDSIGADQLKVAFLPFAAPGHMIPLMDIARLFARHGVDVTYITTPANAVRFQKDIDGDVRSGYKIKILALELPGAEVGLPPGVESFSECTSLSITGKLGAALEKLNEEIEELLREMKVDCIVSDIMLSWTTDAAARLGIPRLVLQVSGYFPECIEHCVNRYSPHEKVGSDDESFVVPGLPHKIEITRSHIPQWLSDKRATDYYEKLLQAEKKSYGKLKNSFYELEADYIEYYNSAVDLKTWAIGPVSLWLNKDVPTDSGADSRIENVELIEWLNSKEPASVLYVSFGSMTKFPSTQLLEIAHGLEDSGHQFIWVVRKMDETEANVEEFLEGFEERVKQTKKSFIIRNWAPQLLILNHPAVAGFLTHCGWNSFLESAYAGQPIIAWPLTAEQFYIEKLVTHVLKIGVSVGAKKWWNSLDSTGLDIVTRDQITKTVTFLMSDDKEAVGMRDRVRELARAANEAVSNGGSSHTSFISLIDELKTIKLKRQCV